MAFNIIHLTSFMLTALVLSEIKKSSGKEMLNERNNGNYRSAEKGTRLDVSLTVLKEKNSENKVIEALKTEIKNAVELFKKENEKHAGMERKLQILKYKELAAENQVKILRKENQGLRSKMMNQDEKINTLNNSLAELQNVVGKKFCIKEITDMIPMGKAYGEDNPKTLMCSKNVIGFRTRFASSTDWITGFQLKCSDGTETEEYKGGIGGQWGGWKSCTGKNVVKGFDYLRYDYSSYTYGSNMEAFCSDGEHLFGKGGSSGYWEGHKECRHGQFLCGVRGRNAGPITKLELLCCICKYA